MLLCCLANEIYQYNTYQYYKIKITKFQYQINIHNIDKIKDFTKA